MSDPKRILVCTKPWTTFHIDDHKGNVKPCCWSKVVCGNINLESIETVWNGSAFVYIRRQMIQDRLDNICAQDCPFRLGQAHEHLLEPSEFVCKQNWSLQQSEIKERQLILQSKPTTMRIVPTVDCNLTCVMCYQDRNDSVVIPHNTEQMLEAYYPHLQELEIIGGEPLINKRCLQIINNIDSTKYPDLRLALITNGTAITDKIEHILRSKNIAWISVSIDAATPETYKKIRGGKLDKVLDGIKRLKHIRQLQEENWHLTIGLILMRANIHELCAFVDLADELEVDFYFTRVVGNWHNENPLTSTEDAELIESALSQLEAYLRVRGKDIGKTAQLRTWQAEMLRNLGSPFLGSVDI